MPPLQYLPYLLPLIIAVLTQGVLAFYAWRHRRTPGAKSFALLMVALCVWSVGYTLELLSGANLPLKVFWASGKYLGVVLAPLAWFTFALEYTGRETWLTPRRLALLSIVPLLTFSLAMTNSVHNLVWSQEQVVAAGPFLALKVAFGPWFWVHTAYSYLLLLLGAILLVQALLHRPHLYQGQMAGLLLGMAAPWLGNAISIFGFNPVPDLDLTPLAFTVTGLMLAWSLFRFRLLDLAPVARETVVESMSDGMIVLDMQAQVVDINPAAQQMIGVPASQVIGRKAAEVFGARPDLVERYRHVTEARDEIEADGEYYELRLSPLKNRRGNLIGRVIILRSITERKQAETALALARDQALEASRLKSELMSRVSHELRTPLGIILGYAEMLRYGSDSSQLDEWQQKALGEIIDSTNGLTGLVNELLDQIQLDARAVKLRIEPFAPQELLRKVEAQMAILAHNKGLAFVATLEPDLPATLSGDETRLRQILINLIGNAIKFTRTGTIRIRLYCRDAEHWAMEVADTGLGIPKEAQQYIFEPFRQVDGSITREHGGTGLGLSIVKHLTDLLGGQVIVKSEIGQGSTFTIVLPLVPCRSQQNAR
ncbi:MAG: PAS domain-containing protein [Anaerolineales bacterium]|nr:PAS domain-containing protein [Anaerolineales bacterium]